MVNKAGRSNGLQGSIGRTLSRIISCRHVRHTVVDCQLQGFKLTLLMDSSTRQDLQVQCAFMSAHSCSELAESLSFYRSLAETLVRFK